MFAVIRTGGKQYRVVENDRIVVERLSGEPGSTIQISDVLMIGGEGDQTLIGGSDLACASVFAEVVEQKRGDKILVFKKKRRKNYRRLKGHQQRLTVLRIDSISPSGKGPEAKAEPASEPKPVASTAPETPDVESKE